jgi:hypothetical protein
MLDMKQTKKVKTIIFLLLVIATNCFSQSVKEGVNSRNTLIAELSINTDLDLYSILYDRLLKPSGALNFGVQTGLTFSTAVETGEKGYSVFYPIRGYFLVGKNNHKLETGFGVRILGFVFPDINLGYRYKPMDNGLVIRAGYNGFVLPGGLNNLTSLNIGYTF